MRYIVEEKKAIACIATMIHIFVLLCVLLSCAK